MKCSDILSLHVMRYIFAFHKTDISLLLDNPVASCFMSGYNIRVLRDINFIIFYPLLLFDTYGTAPLSAVKIKWPHIIHAYNAYLHKCVD